MARLTTWYLMAVIYGHGLSCFEQFRLVKLHSSSLPPSSVDIPVSSLSDPFPNESQDLVHVKTPVDSVLIRLAWDSTFIRIESNNGKAVSLVSGNWAKQLNEVNDDIIDVWETNDGLLVKTKSGSLSVSSSRVHNIDADIRYFCTLTNGQSYALLKNGTLCECNNIHSFVHDVIFTRPLVKQVANGNDHIVLLTENGFMYSFGIGSRGQLGHGDLVSRKHPVMIEALAGITISNISCGSWHSMALTAQGGDIYSWGMNDKGQLGHSSSTITHTICPLPALVTVAGEDARFTAISCGSRHSAGSTDDNKLYTWGWKGYGQVVNDIDIPNIRYIMCGPWSTVYMKDFS